MERIISECNTNLGTKEGELATLQGETWDALVAGHATALTAH